MSRRPINMDGHQVDRELQELENEMKDYASNLRAAEEAKRHGRMSSSKSSGRPSSPSRGGAAAGAGGGRRSPSPSRGGATAGAGGERGPTPRNKRNPDATNILDYLTPEEIEEMQKEIEVLKYTPGSHLYIDPKFSGPIRAVSPSRAAGRATSPSRASETSEQLLNRLREQFRSIHSQKELEARFNRLKYGSVPKRRVHRRKTASKSRSQYIKKVKKAKKAKKLLRNKH